VPCFRFRLRTIMITVAVLALLMGITVARQVDRRSEVLERIEILASDRSVGLTGSGKVWIKVGSGFAKRVSGTPIAPLVF
jgi:hypothetical protein